MKEFGASRSVDHIGTYSIGQVDLYDKTYDTKEEAEAALDHMLQRATGFLVYIPDDDNYRIGFIPQLEET